MDMNASPYFGQIELYGVKDPIKLDGDSPLTLLRSALIQLKAAKPQSGPNGRMITIRLNNQPFVEGKDSNTDKLLEVMSHLDLSDLPTEEELIASMPVETQERLGHPINGDPRYKRMLDCSVPRERLLTHYEEYITLYRSLEKDYPDFMLSVPQREPPG